MIFLKQKSKILGDGLFLKVYGNPALDIDKANKIISIKQDNIDQKILIQNSILKSWTIEIFSNFSALDLKNQSRQRFL